MPHATRRCALLLFAGILSTATLRAQFPAEWHLDEGAHMLTQGGQPVSGLYDPTVVRQVGLQFDQPNHWDLLLANAPTNTRMPATVVIDGVSYPDVGVRLKGSGTPEIMATLKWSFDIDMNFYVAGQNVGGYSSVVLDNASNDPSFLRQVLFTELVRNHGPVEKANFAHLTINGQDWGLYISIQATNSPFLREWFFSNNGSLWQADRPDGLAIGSNGDGTAALNYLGPDTSTYQTYYSLERSEQVQPWDHLVRVADKLNNTPLSALRDTLERHLNVDRTLWFLATEIAFSDRTSYVRRGKDDYLLYQEPESGRMTPLQLDGRSAMRPEEVAWSAFLNANDVNYPLLNRLLAVPELRQRYLAHLRTIIAEDMGAATFNALLAQRMAQIDALVQSDPRKLYTYAEFQQEQFALQEFMNGRRLYLQLEPEVSQTAPTISAVEHRVNGVPWADPMNGQEANVRATVSSTNGISAVRLYYCHGIHGRFTAITMFDDGQHGDDAAGDGIFGGAIPGAPGTTRVRYYIEAAAGNAAQSVSFNPPGAEHDVYTYVVQHPSAPTTTVVINEVMALNTTTVTDNFGDYDDWIEFYNTTSQPVDLSGHWLSDRGAELQMWQFPGGSIIQPNGYMIIWADNDTDQGDGHANFGLNVNGEEVWLTNPQGQVMNVVFFGPQIADMGFARVPNGTGPFLIQAPTFNANNGEGNSIGEHLQAVPVTLFPNPAMQQVMLRSAAPVDVVVYDALLRRVWEGRTDGRTVIDVAAWAPGTYFVQHAGGVEKLMVVR